MKVILRRIYDFICKCNLCNNVMKNTLTSVFRTIAYCPFGPSIWLVNFFVVNKQDVEVDEKTLLGMPLLAKLTSILS